MALTFNPKSEAEVNRPAIVNILLPDGIYDFEVLEATETVSKKGNPMIKVKLGVYKPDGKQQWVWDYIMDSIPHKLRHFCDSIGLLSKYEAGSLGASDCQGRSGKARIKTDISKDPQYADKNAVDDYVVRPAKAIKTQVVDAANGESDDVPF